MEDSTLNLTKSQNSSRIEYLSMKSKALAIKIQNLKEKLTSEFLSETSEAELKLHIELVDKWQKAYDSCTEELEELDTTRMLTNNESFTSEIICVKAALLCELSRFGQSAPGTPTRASTFQAARQDVFAGSQDVPRLPALQLPSFSGEYTEWVDFFALFNSIIERQTNLTKLEKLQHLKSCLKGVALDTIKALEINENNYDIAIQLLKKRFFNKHIIFQAHIQAIVGIRRLETTSSEGLRQITDTVNSNLRALQSMATKEEIADSFINYIVSQKLDNDTQAKWQERASREIYPSWDTLSEFLEHRCQLLDNVNFAIKSRTQSGTISKQRSSFVTCSDSNAKCSFCSSTKHFIYNCTSFQQLVPALRLKEAKKLLLCLNCLKKGHKLNTCKSTNCRQCQGRHHTLLHLKMSNTLLDGTLDKNVFEFQPNRSLQADTQHSQQVLSVSTQPHQSTGIRSENVLLATAIVYVKNKQGLLMPCRAILDCGSQSNFITSRFANVLQLPKSRSDTAISGIGENQLQTDGHEVVLSIVSKDNTYSTSISAIIVKTITDNQPNFNIHPSILKIPSNIVLADSSFHSPNRIDILIGASLFFNLLCVGQINLGSGLPILQKTRLGWIISGGMVTGAKSTSLITRVKTTLAAEPQLDSIIKKFWEIEDFQSSNSLNSAENIQCEEHFLKTHIRQPSGEYAVRFPMKLSIDNLGNSYDLALRRFLNLEKKLSRDVSLKNNYREFIKEYKDLQHMSVIAEADSSKCKYFLPHHCVLKEESSTTKLRVVFDGSAPSSSGYSLNDLLITGPTIQPKLFDILLRFRMFSIAITADISKMYRCVKMSTPDDFLQCILWRDNPNEKIQIYKLNTVTYGTRAAAFLAIRSMQQLAFEEAHKYPLGAETVLKNFYVDDMIAGSNTVERVAKIKQETEDLLRNGNFILRKWCTNCKSINDSIPKSERETLRSFDEASHVTKALGLIWNPIEDIFIFKFDLQPNFKRYTKRIVLSVIARFYDPLGLIGPIITQSKIFMQQLWLHKLHWDESLPQSIQTQWIEIYNQLHDIQGLVFPRYCTMMDSILELHAFCDASLKAYGACIYVLSKRGNERKSVLLCSKSRVAPLKVLSIPKLELCAALLLSELINSLNTLEVLPENIHCWSDSTIVLSWLKGEPSRFNTFVANRVSRIQLQTKGMHWHHISSELNPADLLSRGTSPKALIQSSLWMNGPENLFNGTSYWKDSFEPLSNLPETKQRVLCVAKSIDCTLSYKYINTFTKMQRIFAYVYKFIKRKRSDGISVEDVKNGTNLLIKQVQKFYFQEEIKGLHNKGIVPKSSCIVSLSPFLDETGLLRVGGRLKLSNLQYDSRHPIILPKNHPLSMSIIMYFHNKLHHAGPQALLATLRLTYWPLGGKTMVSRVIHKCIRCFRSKPTLIQHVMGDLPPERVTPSPAFYITGVDYCGPLYYQPDIRNRKPTKCYLSLFICFTTKAVHLELVKDLSTASFIAALRRFISIRGRPKAIWSDNATNFVGAKNELNELKNLFNTSDHCEKVQNYCVSESIEWHFIPPRSPHFGGLWEAAVKTAKHHLFRTISDTLLNFEELRTLVYQISSTINSRPLVPISECPDDLNVLTPAHFLIGGPFTAISEPNLLNSNFNRLDRWQRVQQLNQIFWKRWSSEYLTLLQQRGKWRSGKPNVNIGALVLVKDENLPSLKWPLARVINVIKGPDGVVRVAILKTPNGEIKRAVNKLCLLPNEERVESQISQRGEDVEIT